MKQVFPMDSRVTYDAEGRPSYDRAVSSKPLRSLIRKLFTTGVMPNPSDTCQVRAGGDGMTLIVNPGLAVLEGGLYLEDAARTLSVTAADPTFDRIDTVVLRWNENDAVRDCDLHVVAGVPAKNPVRPALNREGSIYEIGLADVFVTKGVATITNEKITDTRMESARCGIVSSVSEWDTTTIYQQIQSELANFKSDEEVAFANWFDYMKDQLTEDAAGRLQTEVDDVRGQIHTNLLNPTLPTKTENGITCTNNGDGTYTLNGTATADTFFDNNDGSEFVTFPAGKYHYSGTPSGGSNSTYKSGLFVDAEHQNNDFGSGVDIAFDGTQRCVFRIVVYKNTTFPSGGLVFKPMLTTDLSADYDSFVKYSGSEERLNEQVASLHESSKGVITNLIDPTLGTTTNNGVTCTANGDGTYTLNGAGTSYWNNFPIETNLTLETGKVYKICGGENHQSTTTYLIELVSIRISDGHRDVVTNEIQKSTFIALSGYKYEYRIHTFENAKFTNVLIKPMLTTDLDATYNDYVPYSGDGRLNENVAKIYDKVEKNTEDIATHTDEIAQINADLSELMSRELAHQQGSTSLTWENLLRSLLPTLNSLDNETLQKCVFNAVQNGVTKHFRLSSYENGGYYVFNRTTNNANLVLIETVNIGPNATYSQASIQSSGTSIADFTSHNTNGVRASIEKI